MTENIDGLLANFSRELDYFLLTRDGLQPVMEPLLAALERFVTNASDGVALIEVQHLRFAYLQRLTEVRSMLEEWVRVRGAGERLRQAAGSMSQVQTQRFHSLLARDAGISVGRTAFETLQGTVHERLAIFDDLST